METKPKISTETSSIFAQTTKVNDQDQEEYDEEGGEEDYGEEGDEGYEEGYEEGDEEELPPPELEQPT